ncbi:MAG: hypothetical protein KDA78_03345 [Planctomycetaceae bacterium]|nr:hypothetical protein [Planctomycetaceae bacterium]
MMNCKQVSHLLSECKEGNLPFWQCVQLRLHLRMCRVCHRLKHQLDFISRMARQYGALQDETSLADSSLTLEARQRIQESIQEHL